MTNLNQYPKTRFRRAWSAFARPSRPAVGPLHDIGSSLERVPHSSSGSTPTRDVARELDRVARSARLKRRLMLADAAALSVGVIVAFELQSLLRPVPLGTAYRHLVLVAVSLPFLLAAAVVNRLYLARANERPAEEIGNILRTVGVGVAVILGAAFAVQFDELSRLWVVLFAVSTFGALVLERWIARRIFTKLRLKGEIRRRIVVIGTDAHAVSIVHTYERNPALGYEVVGFVGDDDLGQRAGVRVLGGLDDLLRILHEHDAVGVVVSLASVDSDQVNTLTRRLTDEGFHVALSSSLRDIDVSRLRAQDLDGRAMIYVEPTMRDGWRALAKRLFDVAAATLLLALTLPILFVSAVAIKLTSQGPVLFHQVRVGRHGNLFRLVKLRTMVCDAEQRRAELEDLNERDGPLFKIEHDPRVTPVGRVLRKLSIDELPQLYCVLRGSMSMVGPRPALPDEVSQWGEDVAERLRVLPGLTGMWQVSGRTTATFDDYKRLDLYYVDNWSLKHDVKICLKTVRVVITGHGAS